MKACLHRSIIPFLLACIVLAHESRAQTANLSINKSTGAVFFGAAPGVQFANFADNQLRVDGTQFVGTPGESVTFGGSFTIDADTTITGGGTLSLGGFTATVPATGTLAMGAGTN